MPQPAALQEPVGRAIARRPHQVKGTAGALVERALTADSSGGTIGATPAPDGAAAIT